MSGMNDAMLRRMEECDRMRALDQVLERISVSALLMDDAIDSLREMGLKTPAAGLAEAMKEISLLANDIRFMANECSEVIVGTRRRD